MCHFRRAVFLGVVMAVALPSCAEKAVKVEPIKVPLVTTAISKDIAYLPPLGAKSPKWLDFNEENPTKKFSLGGIECVVTVEMPIIQISNDGQVLGKLLLKTPSQAFTFNLNVDNKPMEFTLDNGRKYFLGGYGYTSSPTNSKTMKEIATASVRFEPAGVQIGKIGQSPIALFDANRDGFYTSDEDGIVVGPPAELFARTSVMPNISIAQPFSKYISTSDGIFEIRNLAKDGSELTLLPYRGASATLEVVAPPRYAGQIVLTSADAGLNVTVTVGDKASESVAVIPGGYTVLATMLSPPKDSQAVGSWVRVSGAEMSALKVEAGAKRVLVLGGPKVLEFQATLVDGKVVIKTPNLKGEAGETYQGVYDSKNQPEVYLNVDGKPTLLGKMEFG